MKKVLNNISTVRKRYLVIILAFLALLITALGLKFYSYSNLEDTAKTLPVYKGVSIATGEQGRRECYINEGQKSCRALTVIIEDLHNTTAETTRFVNKLRDQGVRWPDNSAARSLDSSPFERNGHTYQIYILHGTDNKTWISLIEH